jgi:hypothetical protein
LKEEALANKQGRLKPIPGTLAKGLAGAYLVKKTD